MVLDIFLMLMAIGFILFIMGIERENQGYAGLSLIIWLVIFVQSFYITVPGDTDYSELGIQALSLAFVFINLVIMLVIQFDWRKKLP